VAGRFALQRVSGRPVASLTDYRGRDATSSARSTATVLVVSVAAFLASLDLFIVNIAFPEIRTAFGNPDLGAMSWILNGYTIVFAAFLNPAGRLGDRYGHRRVFLCGLVVFTVGSAACGLSGSFVMLVASRVVQALGAAMLMPSSLALLMAAVPASRRAAAVSKWSAIDKHRPATRHRLGHRGLDHDLPTGYRPDHHQARLGVHRRSRKHISVDRCGIRRLVAKR
ncbi:MFS transporter, partial [Mycobacterium sp.]|uniref:MFS transporter n=1 Tax=Mycobacterium sp. TaxID=1785 RepID=UPI003F995396